MSTVFTRFPLTTTSRRRVWACAVEKAVRPQPTNTRLASAPAVVWRTSLRVVMVRPPCFHLHAGVIKSACAVKKITNAFGVDNNDAYQPWDLRDGCAP